jgi:hypothetical protein
VPEQDSASRHRTRLIRNGFAKRRHRHQHVTPPSSSWNSQVERFLALLAAKQIKRGAHNWGQTVDCTIASSSVHPRAQRQSKASALGQKSAADIGCVHRPLQPPHPGWPRARWIGPAKLRASLVSGQTVANTAQPAALSAEVHAEEIAKADVATELAQQTGEVYILLPAVEHQALIEAPFRMPGCADRTSPSCRTYM